MFFAIRYKFDFYTKSSIYIETKPIHHAHVLCCIFTASMITREQLEKLKNTDWFTPQFDRPLNDEEAEESEVDHP